MSRTAFSTTRSIISRAVFALLTLKVQSEDTVLPNSIYYNLDRFTRSECFLTQNRRQYDANDRMLDMHLANFREDYQGRIKTNDYHVDFIELKLLELENLIKSLVLLDESYNYCELKYRSELSNLIAIRKSLAKCKSKSKVAIESLIKPAETIRNKLKLYYAKELVQLLKDCKSNSVDSEIKYRTCIVNVIKSTNNFTSMSIYNFHNHLTHAKCSASHLIKESFHCYAAVFDRAFSKAGKVKGLMKSCLDNKKLCPLCSYSEAEIDGSTFLADHCPYQLSWHLLERDITSEHIENPFRGINVSTTCLKINFITKGETQKTAE